MEELKNNEEFNLKNSFIKYFIILLPIWWFIGLDPVIFHIGSIIYFLKIFSIKRTKMKIPLEGHFLFAFILIYCFSLSYNYPFNPTEKTLASVFNLSFWVMGLLLLISIYNDDTFDEGIILKPMVFLNLLIFGVLVVSLALFYFFGIENLKTHSLLSLADPGLGKVPVLKDYFARLLIFRREVFYGGILPRLSVFFPYPLSLSLFLVMSVPLGCLFFWMRGKKKNAGYFLLSGIFTLFFTLSRVPFLSFLFIMGTLCIMLFLRGKEFRKVRHILRFVIITILLISPVWINLMKNLFFSVRPHSASTRIYSYKEAIKLIMKHPFFGIGIKVRDPNIFIPIGTHCTYIEILLKTGFVGLFFSLLFLFTVLYRMILLLKRAEGIEREKTLFYLASFLLTIIWMVVGNIDYLSLPTALFFAISAVVLRNYRRLVANEGKA